MVSIADAASDADAAYTGGWREWTLPDDSLSPGNAPYGTNRLLLSSCAPLLTAHECERLIELMEAHGAAEGWDTRYPVTGYTREVNVGDIPEATALLREALATRLLPACAELFPSFGVETLRVNEALVVKYDAASGHNCLPVHQDFALLTINVALSPPGAYTGSGTWFQHSGETLASARGEAVVHAGRIAHCGVPVSSGVRHQLVLFLLSTEHAELAGRLQAIGAATGATAGAKDLRLSTASLRRAVAMADGAADGETWKLLGHNHRHAKRLAEAEDCFAMADTLSRGRDFAAKLALADVQTERGRAADALATLAAAIELGPPPGPTEARETLTARHNLGIALLALGEHAQAGLAFEGVVGEDPEAAVSWSGLALCMSELGQPEAALACQREVLRLRAARKG